MIGQDELAQIVAAQPLGKRVARLLENLRAIGGTELSEIRSAGAPLPSEHFRRIYEIRIEYLRDLNAHVEPTLVDAIEDLRDWAGDARVVAFTCQARHIVLFLSPGGQVVAGFTDGDERN